MIYGVGMVGFTEPGGAHMNIFKYRIYHEHRGPSKEYPFATKPLSADQVQHYLDKLCAILPHDFSATAKDNSLYVTSHTSDSNQDTETNSVHCVLILNRATSGLALRS